MKIPEIEISIKFKGALKSELRKIKTSTDVMQVVRLLFDANTIDWVEEVVMLCLNNDNKVIGYYRVSSGGMTVSCFDIRVMATVALTSLATSVIVAHNHPSGSKTPSQSDINMSKRLKDGLALLDIKLTDSLIITDESYTSLMDEGYL